MVWNCHCVICVHAGGVTEEQGPYWCELKFGIKLFIWQTKFEKLYKETYCVQWYRYFMAILYMELCIWHNLNKRGLLILKIFINVTLETFYTMQNSACKHFLDFPSSKSHVKKWSEILDKSEASDWLHHKSFIKICC